VLASGFEKISSTNLYVETATKKINNTRIFGVFRFYDDDFVVPESSMTYQFNRMVDIPHF